MGVTVQPTRYVVAGVAQEVVENIAMNVSNDNISVAAAVLVG